MASIEDAHHLQHRPAAPAAGGRGTPLIGLDRVRKSFGETVALDDVSLDVPEGEFFCLLGPSGCGKSTLLRMLAGFEMPDSGALRLDGRDIAHDPPHRRPLNMMFQSYALFPHLTVADNVAYGIRRAGWRRAEVAARVAELLVLLRLDGLGARYPAQISGGQRQRTALARALARRPRLLLLDEPLAALDKRLREETQGELKALQAELGTTFIMVTHDQAEAMALADRIGLMEAGRLVQVGTPRVVYERPRTRFAATFLGDVNLIPGKVTELRDRTVWILTHLTERPLEIDQPTDRELGSGDRVTLAVRPEAIGITSAAGPPGPNALDATILDSLYLGDRTALRVKAARGEVLRISRASGGLHDLALRRADETIRLELPRAAAVLRD